MPASVKTVVEPRLERLSLVDGVAREMVDYLRDPSKRVTIRILGETVALRSDLAPRLPDGDAEPVLRVPARVEALNGKAWEPYPTLAPAGWYVGSDSSCAGEHTIVIAMLKGGTYVLFSPEGEPDELLMSEARKNGLMIGEGYSML